MVRHGLNIGPSRLQHLVVLIAVVINFIFRQMLFETLQKMSVNIFVNHFIIRRYFIFLYRQLSFQFQLIIIIRINELVTLEFLLVVNQGVFDKVSAQKIDVTFIYFLCTII
jgi:hypothetical protein